MKALTALLILLCVGCTVTPPMPKPRSVPVYAGNSATGGIVAALYSGDKPSEAGFVGFLVTQEWVDGYNSLASDYGYILRPRAKPGDDIVPADSLTLAKYHLATGYIVDAQRMVAWKDLRDMPLLGAEKESVLSKVINTISK